VTIWDRFERMALDRAFSFHDLEVLILSFQIF
jgi:hypothetical protein